MSEHICAPFSVRSFCWSRVTPHWLKSSLSLSPSSTCHPLLWASLKDRSWDEHAISTRHICGYSMSTSEVSTSALTPVRTGWNGISRGTWRNRLHHQFHRSVKTSYIIFDTIITAESWVEWNISHLAKNASQVQMFPDISKRWSIVERRWGKGDSGCLNWTRDRDRGSKRHHTRMWIPVVTWRAMWHCYAADLE